MLLVWFFNIPITPTPSPSPVTHPVSLTLLTLWCRCSASQWSLMQLSVRLQLINKELSV